jgi:hypothetical protein
MQVNQQIRAFALQVQDSLNRRDPTFFNEYFDFRRSAARMQAVLARYPLSNREMLQYSNLYSLGWCDYGQMLVDQLKEGSSFRYLGWSEQGSLYSLIFRLMDVNMNLNYFEVLLSMRDDKFVIRDVLDYREGEYYGELYPILLGLEFSPNSFRQRMARLVGLDRSFYQLHLEFRKLVNGRNYVQAMNVWETFPQEMKDRKYYLLQKIQVCAQLRSERFLDAVEGYRNSFQADGSFFLVALDGYRENGMYDTALECLNRLDQHVGGDAALNFHRGRLNLWMGRQEEAASYGQLFAFIEPSCEAGYELLEHVLPASGRVQALA